MIQYIANFAVGACVVWFLYQLARSTAFLTQAALVISAVRGWMILLVLPTLTLVIMTMTGLQKLHPWFDIGWMKLLTGHSGNVVLLPSTAAAAAGGVSGAVLATIFLLAFLIAVPQLAMFEERVFRRGKHTHTAHLTSSIQFGLVHLIAGIPLSAAIALIWGGLLFGAVYRRVYTRSLALQFPPSVADEVALLHSTAMHVVINVTLILALIAALWI